MRETDARILARIAKIRSGNLGDWSSLTNAQGICEFREFLDLANVFTLQENLRKL